MINKKTVIGVIVHKSAGDINKEIWSTPYYWVTQRIIDMIAENGCFPLVLHYDNDFLDFYMDVIDGLLIVGGRDIHPKFYNGKAMKADYQMGGFMLDERMNFQDKIFNRIFIQKEKNIPVLGICGGMQCLSVFFGGDLVQDIESEVETEIEHRNGNRLHTDIAHNIIIDKNSKLYSILEKEEIGVTSNHHQSLKNVPEVFKVVARAPDGVIEAIEMNDYSFCLGLQWHIERKATSDDVEISKHFVDLCKK